MKTIVRLFVSIFAGTASVAFAAPGAATKDAGFLAYLFVGFFALIIVTQLVPAMILFFGMVKGLFSQEKKDVSSVQVK